MLISFTSLEVVYGYPKTQNFRKYMLFKYMNLQLWMLFKILKKLSLNITYRMPIVVRNYTDEDKILTVSSYVLTV